jgi:hypothetical protein
MRLIWTSIIGLMVLIGALAIDIAVFRSVGRVLTLSTRVGLIGVLPMATLLAVYAVVVVSGLVHRGEIPLSRIAFLLVGGMAILMVVYASILAPDLFFDYIDITAVPLQNLTLTQAQQSAIAQGQMLAPIYNLGLGTMNVSLITILCAAVSPLLLVPALFAGWLARGHRLKLCKRDEPKGD